MWSWLSQNVEIISAFIYLGMLFVWLFYAQLLFSGFRRQRQPRLLINQGWGEGVNSVCLVSNMSHEPMYIQRILMTLRTAQASYRSSITDFDDADPWNRRAPAEDITRQGPLHAGGHMNLGTFHRLICQAATQHGLIEDEHDPIIAISLRNITITVISHYGPESGVIGFQRKFIIKGDNNELMRPESIDTQRLTNFRARRKMRRLLQELI
jgi:hypothetical protein